MRRLLSVTLAVSVVAAGVGRAAAISRDEREGQPVALWSIDPGALGGGGSDRNVALAEAAMVFAVTRSVGTDNAGALGALIRRELLGASPYRLTLLKFHATCRPPVHNDPAPTSIDALEAVLEIEHPSNPDAIVTALRSSLANTPESALTLPDQSVGHSLSRNGEPPSHTLEWTTRGSSLLIGLGAGSLADWLAPPVPEPSDTPTVARHQAALPHDGRLSLQLWIDLNALRRDAPDLFAYGRFAYLAKPWGLLNSRSLLVEGRTIATDVTHPPLLAVSSAWSLRSESLNAVHAQDLATGVWPPWLAATGGGAAYAVILSDSLRDLVYGGIDLATHLAARPSDFSSRVGRWGRDGAEFLVRTFRALDDPAIVLGPGPKGVAAIIPIRRESQGARSDVEGLMSSLSPAVTGAGTPDAWRFSVHQQASPALVGLSWRLSSDGRTLEAIWTDAQP
jgi:hypothetical protein